MAGTLPPRPVLATSFRGRELSYVVIDGMAVHAGDMVLGRVEDLEPRPPLAESRKPPGRTPLQRRDLSPQRGKYLWPEAVVPYIIDTDVSTEQRQDIEEAIRAWNDSTIKGQAAVYVGEIKGKYQFEPSDPYFHWRPVTCTDEASPRANFRKDLLHLFGASMTICQIKRNNAEDWLAAMRKLGWKSDPGIKGQSGSLDDSEDEATAVGVDLEQLGRDQIAQLISATSWGPRPS